MHGINGMQFGTFEALGIATLVLDQRLMIVYANTKASALLSPDSKDLPGNLVDYLLPAGLTSTQASPDLVQFLSTVNHKEMEFQTALSRTDNSVFYARIIASTVNGCDSKEGYCLLIEDITATQQMIKDLALSAQVFEHTGEPIMITDRRDRILTRNRESSARII